ncbi:ATP-dependent nuclease [Paraburkholderia aromaticivorans]|uniref:ATP-dependent nuclease n=1 Tax=Paraburkholderia aromaticivorans TaxID=2026199 RepID=UPI001455EE5D|nr:AAA family ATPase [Paraburkholderia aromaticivorans]
MAIPTGICAIVGGNGVGKSALLAAISELLADPEMPLGVGHQARLRNSELQGTVTDQVGRKDIIVREDADGVRTLGEGKFEAEFYWLEPSYLVNLTHKQVNEDANFSDLLEPLSPSTLDADELETLWYLLGKKIDSCSIYEITEYGDLDPFPYFIAEAGGHSYGSESMGYGELSLLFVLWKLRTIEKNSVLVLEEPEAHVSPRSQRALMDILARACDEKGLSIILTTHSPAIIANLPNRNIVLISKSANGTSASIGPSKVQVNDLLGATTLKRALVLVEDRAAHQFALALLGETNLDVLSHVEVVEAGSAAKIDSVLSTLPLSRHGWLNVIGVYDGDMRARVDSRHFNWPHLFLPGEVSPEHILRDGLTSRHDGQDLLATELRRARDAVGVALDAVDGLDAHDWFTQLPVSLGCDHPALMAALVRIWLRDNKPAADAFVQSIVDKINLTV